MPALVVEDLHVHYGAIHAVRGVSFTVESGEIVGASVAEVAVEAAPIAAPVAAAKPEPRAERPERTERHDRRPREDHRPDRRNAPANDDSRDRRNRYRERDDGPTPVGFGDDIPAFMLIVASAGKN